MAETTDRDGRPGTSLAWMPVPEVDEPEWIELPTPGRGASDAEFADWFVSAFGYPLPADPNPHVATAGPVEPPPWLDEASDTAVEEADVAWRIEMGEEFLPSDPDASVWDPDPAWFADAAPGAALARFVQDTPPTTLGDWELVEYVAAAGRLEAWAHHRAAAAAAELARREAMAPAPSGEGLLTAADTAGAELSLRLGCSLRTGKALVAEGQAYDNLLHATGAALASGAIDAGKARVIREYLTGVEPMVALAAERIVLDDAPQRTHRQLAKDVRDAVVQADPAHAAERRRGAEASRYVSRPKPMPNGMAGMWALLPAPAAQATWEALDSRARTARNAGDPRTLDQLRADLLADQVLSPACLAAEHEPHDTRPAASAARPNAVIPEPGSYDAGPWCNGVRPAFGVDVRVVVPLSTLLGGDEPGDLAGYGAIDPDAARALAAGGTWRRLVTDPTTGAVLDVGTTRYQPPAELARLVYERDITCVNPRCDTPAHRCDLDHTTEFPVGPTAAENLGPASRTCHNLKTHTRFDLEQPEPGRFTWTTPTGHTYERPPAAPLPSVDAQRRLYAPLRAEAAGVDGSAPGGPDPPDTRHDHPPGIGSDGTGSDTPGTDFCAVPPY